MITDRVSHRSRLSGNSLYDTSNSGNPLTVTEGKAIPFGWTLVGVLAVSGFVWWLLFMAFRWGA